MPRATPEDRVTIARHPFKNNRVTKLVHLAGFLQDRALDTPLDPVPAPTEGEHLGRELQAAVPPSSVQGQSASVGVLRESPTGCTERRPRSLVFSLTTKGVQI